MARISFDFIRNNYINATNFFSAKDTLHQNQYGGTFGGKIMRDKLFFFGGYQRLRPLSAGLDHALRCPRQPCWPATSPRLRPRPASTSRRQFSSQPTDRRLLPNDMIAPRTSTTTSLALVKYLPAATDACGLANLRDPVLSDGEPVHHPQSIDHQRQAQPVRPLLPRRLRDPGSVFADQHPDHPPTRQL